MNRLTAYNSETEIPVDTYGASGQLEKRGIYIAEFDGAHVFVEPARPTLLSITDTGVNQLDDFPPEAFRRLAICEDCGYQASLNRDHLLTGVTIQELPRRLRCS